MIIFLFHVSLPRRVVDRTPSHVVNNRCCLVFLLKPSRLRGCSRPSVHHVAAVPVLREEVPRDRRCGRRQRAVHRRHGRLRPPAGVQQHRGHDSAQVKSNSVVNPQAFFGHAIKEKFIKL